MTTNSLSSSILQVPKTPASPVVIYTVPESDDQHRVVHLLHLFFTSDASKTEVTVSVGNLSLVLWIATQSSEKLSICVTTGPQSQPVSVSASRDGIYVTGYVTVGGPS